MILVDLVYCSECSTFLTFLDGLLKKVGQVDRVPEKSWECGNFCQSLLNSTYNFKGSIS